MMMTIVFRSIKVSLVFFLMILCFHNIILSSDDDDSYNNIIYFDWHHTLGNIVIGDHAVIGSGSLVLKPIPAGKNPTTSTLYKYIKTNRYM